MALVSRRTVVATGAALGALGVVGYGLWPDMEGYADEVQRQRQMLGAEPGLADLVRMATLAANSHNTQPWRFRLWDDSITILRDLTRRTGAVDPDNHHLYVSLGCAAENLAIAGSAVGRTGEVAVTTGAEPAIAVELAPAAPGPEDLYRAIPLRQSTRSVYDGRQVSPAELALLEEAAREDGVSILVFTEPRDIGAILEFVVAANGAQMGDPAFVKELRDWLRFSPARAVETGDGLFSACSGNPVAPDWIGVRMFDAFFTPDTENDKYRAQVESSAGIAVFVGDRDDPEHWIRVGRSFERFALRATTLGIRTAHLNQPVEVAAFRPEFARWLGIPDRRPDLVIRFGRGLAMPMSLRRPVSDVIL